MIYKYFFVHYEIMFYHSWQFMNSETRIKNKGSLISVLKNQKGKSVKSLCYLGQIFYHTLCNITKRKGTICNAKKAMQ